MRNYNRHECTYRPKEVEKIRETRNIQKLTETKGIYFNFLRLESEFEAAISEETK